MTESIQKLPELASKLSHFLKVAAHEVIIATFAVKSCWWQHEVVCDLVRSHCNPRHLPKRNDIENHSQSKCTAVEPVPMDTKHAGNIVEEG